jgi:hypothetical protein
LLQPIDWQSTWSVGAALVMALALLIFARRHARRDRPATGGPVMPPLPKPERAGTLDGAGAGDHDLPFHFGRRPHALWPYPFNTLQYARLLLLRSRWQDGLVGEDDAASADDRQLAGATGRGPSPTQA